MNFVSFKYNVFLLLCVCLYYLFPQKYRWIVLLVGSFFFYILESKSSIVILLVMIIINKNLYPPFEMGVRDLSADFVENTKENNLNVF